MRKKNHINPDEDDSPWRCEICNKAHPLRGFAQKNCCKELKAREENLEEPEQGVSYG